MRVARGLRHAIPPSSDAYYDPGDNAIVRNENVINNRIGEWIEPLTVLGMDPQNKLFYVYEAKIGPQDR